MRAYLARVSLTAKYLAGAGEGHPPLPREPAAASSLSPVAPVAAHVTAPLLPRPPPLTSRTRGRARSALKGQARPGRTWRGERP